MHPRLQLFILSGLCLALSLHPCAGARWTDGAGAIGTVERRSQENIQKLSLNVSDSNLRDDVILRKERDTGINPFHVKQLAWEPRAFLHKGFLSPAECEHLISLAKPKLRESMVTDNDSGKSKKSEVRTSLGMFIQSKDPIVDTIERRIADWTFLPPENGEAMQVLHYENLQKYDPHVDYFVDKVNSKWGGHRYATVLMYLSDVDEGGETVFPDSKAPHGYSSDGLSPCAKKGVAVKPHRGDALLFYSLHLDGSLDDHSLHASCPVLKGEKWSATKWIHVDSFGARKDDGGCNDSRVDCISWALKGECSANPGYMHANCKKSCKKC